MNREWTPRIVAFVCNWCTYAAADLAGTSRMQQPDSVRIVRLMCSGRADPQFVLEAIANGADGVIVAGCHPPSDCHYQEGNYRAFRRFMLLRRVLESMGVEKERFRLEWISASEARKWVEVVRSMTEDLKRLGPLRRDEEGIKVE
ncbi:MAG: hydrogenase iron-sulfur subunit [Fervidicoccaceae archaeon]